MVDICSSTATHAHLFESLLLSCEAMNVLIITLKWLEYNIVILWIQKLSNVTVLKYKIKNILNFHNCLDLKKLKEKDLKFSIARCPIKR